MNDPPHIRYEYTVRGRTYQSDLVYPYGVAAVVVAKLVARYAPGRQAVIR